MTMKFMLNVFCLAISSLLLLGSENSANTSPNQFRALGSIDWSPDSSLFVVINNRASLGVVCAQSFLQGLGIIV